jgi:hypothetical protein
LAAPRRLYVVEAMRACKWIYMSVHTERALAEYDAGGYAVARVVTYDRRKAKP